MVWPSRFPVFDIWCWKKGEHFAKHHEVFCHKTADSSFHISIEDISEDSAVDGTSAVTSLPVQGLQTGSHEEKELKQETEGRGKHTHNHKNLKTQKHHSCMLTQKHYTHTHTHTHTHIYNAISKKTLQKILVML